jgi:hypothetical protein
MTGYATRGDERRREGSRRRDPAANENPQVTVALTSGKLRQPALTAAAPAAPVLPEPTAAGISAGPEAFPVPAIPAIPAVPVVPAVREIPDVARAPVGSVVAGWPLRHRAERLVVRHPVVGVPDADGPRLAASGRSRPAIRRQYPRQARPLTRELFRVAHDRLLT